MAQEGPWSMWDEGNTAWKAEAKRTGLFSLSSTRGTQPSPRQTSTLGLSLLPTGRCTQDNGVGAGDGDPCVPQPGDSPPWPLVQVPGLRNQEVRAQGHVSSVSVWLPSHTTLLFWLQGFGVTTAQLHLPVFHQNGSERHGLGQVPQNLACKQQHHSLHKHLLGKPTSTHLTWCDFLMRITPQSRPHPGE